MTSQKNQNMKKLIWLCVAFFTVTLTSCFDVVETVDLKEDGSGNYEIKLDLTGAFEMMNSMKGMMGEEASKKSSKKQMENKDSSFTLEKDVMENNVLTAEEKAVFKHGKVNIKLNEEKSEGVIVMNFPFKSPNEFQIIQKVMNSNKRKEVGFGAVGNILGKETEQFTEEKPNAEGGIVGDFKYELTKNTFARTVNEKNKNSKPEEEKLDDKEQKLMEQFATMMQIKSVLIVNLPSAAKNVTGKNITVSEDKKRIEFSKKFSMDKKPAPADFDFKIEF